jgi:hypothetical protein
MSLCGRSFLIVLFGLFATVAASAEGGGGGGGGLLRRDFAFGLGMASTFFDETAAGIFYQHSGGFPELELDLRIGLRTEIFSLGATGSYALAWVNAVKKADHGIYEKYRYDAHQALAGGFVTYNVLGSGKDTTELLFEYYPYASHSIKYADDTAQNPFRAGDEIKGNGWGAGFGGTRGDGSLWLIYRSLNLTEGSLNGQSQTWPTANHNRVHVQTVTLLIGRSI